MNHLPSRLSRSSLNRRHALQLAAIGGGLAGIGMNSALAQSSATPAAAGSTPISGEPAAELAAFDAIMTKMMQKYSIPGGQLAIARDNRLVLNHGYGLASVEDDEPVTPNSRFRIASTSKPFTGVAIQQLIDAGQLTLDTPAFPLLALEPAPNTVQDPRLDKITIRHLLEHSGGWNSAGTGMDPQYVPWTLVASHIFDAEDPADAETIVRYMQGQPLDFDPGSLSAYSNFGFNVLGRVIEKITGMPYADSVAQSILTPTGITSMAIGGTTLDERLENEVRYYAAKDVPMVVSVFPGVGYVPQGYGYYYMPALDAHGGWISTASDLIRFALAVDGKLGTALLKPASVKAMESSTRPKAVAAGAGNADEAHGLAFNSQAVGDGWEWSHAGALEGACASWLMRSPTGTTAAFLFNSLPVDYGSFFGDIIPTLQAELAATTTWPSTDLFTS